MVAVSAQDQSEARRTAAPIRDADGPAAGHPAARSLAQLESSQTAMRDTTKWLVAAVAAVGAVIVAGLQLSNLPSGLLGAAPALLGVAAALLGVAMILRRAAGVLASGYTTLGELADLGSGDYQEELRRAEEWDNRINPWLEKRDTLKEEPESWKGNILLALYAVRLALLINLRRLTERQAKNEGLPVEKMLTYLNRDVFFFASGLATNINQLYEALTSTDREILELRGEDVAVSETIEEEGDETEETDETDEGDVAEEGDEAEETDKTEEADETDEGDVANEGGESTVSQGERMGGLSESTGTGKARGEEAAIAGIGDDSRAGDAVAINAVQRASDDGGEALKRAEWRQARLETAAGELIAFANQALMEHRFRRLQRSIFSWGSVIALGVALFAVAPQIADPRPLAITAPTRVALTVIGNGFQGKCPPNSTLQGVAVGGTWEEPIVVTDASGDCPAQKITLDSQQAIAVPVVPSSASPTSSSPSPSPSSPTG